MKGKKVLQILLVLLATTACERDWNNPWDEKANVDPGDWMPEELRITQSDSFGEVSLGWYSGSALCEGFRVLRETNGNGNWLQVGSVSMDQAAHGSMLTYTDRGISLQGNRYSYRVYAYAGSSSSDATPEVDISLPRVKTDFVEISGSGHPRVSAQVEQSGSSSVNMRGILWGENPALLLTGGFAGKTEEGSGTGNFNSIISGLTPGKIYYFRAYATNGEGTGYGGILSYEAP